MENLIFNSIEEVLTYRSNSYKDFIFNSIVNDLLYPLEDATKEDLEAIKEDGVIDVYNFNSDVSDRLVIAIVCEYGLYKNECQKQFVEDVMQVINYAKEHYEEEV